jgi:hypothetical protein
MIRLCTIVALCELAIMAMFLGLPNAYADPAMLCCGADNSANCSGCQGNYLVGDNELLACMEGGVDLGCTTQDVICFNYQGTIARYKATGCIRFDRWSGGFALSKQGCQPLMDCN